MKYVAIIVLGVLIGLQLGNASPVIVYQDNPIIKDQTITVDTYYDNRTFDGYHTVIYSTRQPNFLFFHQINLQSIDIVHSWAKCWITQKINEMMIARCQATCEAPQTSHTELYTISEDEAEEDTCL